MKRRLTLSREIPAMPTPQAGTRPLQLPGSPSTDFPREFPSDLSLETLSLELTSAEPTARPSSSTTTAESSGSVEAVEADVDIASDWLFFDDDG